jgi:hypothetical protein
VRNQGTVANLWLGGKAEDMGDTCVVPPLSVSKPMELAVIGGTLVLGVAGVPPVIGTFPINHD